MYVKLTNSQLAQVADILIDATILPPLKRYARELYGPDAYSAQVIVNRHSSGALLSLRVLVWDQNGCYLYPDVCLPYWRKVDREENAFESCQDQEDRCITAEAYLMKCQVPQAYGIATTRTDEIVLDQIKELCEIDLYINESLSIAKLMLTYPRTQEGVKEKVAIRIS